MFVLTVFPHKGNLSLLKLGFALFELIRNSVPFCNSQVVTVCTSMLPMLGNSGDIWPIGRRGRNSDIQTTLARRRNSDIPGMNRTDKVGLEELEKSLQNPLKH